MAEKFLSTLLLMFISSCYFNCNARRARYSCREKKRYCNKDDTRARSSSEIPEKRNEQKKKNFNKDI